VLEQLVIICIRLKRKRNSTRPSLWRHASSKKGEAAVEEPRRANSRDGAPDNQHVGVLGSAAQSRSELEYRKAGEIYPLKHIISATSTLVMEISDLDVEVRVQLPGQWLEGAAAWLDFEQGLDRETHLASR
jgi:hypothetical protein